VAARKKKESRRVGKKRPPTNLKGHVEPSTRVFTDWTEARIKSAEHMAQSGELRLAADLCEYLLTDDRVASALTTRVQSLLGLDPTFERSGDKRRSAKAVKALEAEEDWWAAYPESELALIHKWGLLLGVAPAQQPWPQDDRRTATHWLPKPEFWHPQHLRQDQRTKRWWIKAATEGNASAASQEVEIIPGQPEWILHCPYGKNRPHMWGLWRPLARMVLIKQLARGDWSRAGEKSALLAITVASDALDDMESTLAYPQDAQRQLATDIYNRGRNGVAALPPGVDIKAVDTVAKAKELYESPIQLIDAAIAILIRGGNLGTLTEGGSKAAAEVQERTTDLPRLRFDAQSLTTTIHDQSLVWWAEFNFGDRMLAPWPVYPVEPDEDLRSKAETEQWALYNVDRAEKLGFKVDRQQFLDDFKIGWAKPGERPKAPEPPPKPDPNPDDPGADPQGGGTPQPDPNAPAAEPQGGAAAGRDGAARPVAQAASGFDDGDEYADRLFERSKRHGAKELAATVAAMIAEVRKAESYDEARRLIAERYESLLPPTQLASLTDAALQMGQLAGHLSVRQDVPELDE
jgi:hypothetical protein